MVIRDQIHGDITLSSVEQKLIETPIFERLRNIKQLAFAEYEYPGANHTRYQHSIGACQCVTDMYNAVCTNSPDFYQEGDLSLLRMIALVHDLGHAPFSHASEELSNITHEERLEGILLKLKDYIKLDINNFGIPDYQLVYQVYLGVGVVYAQHPHLITLHDFMDGIIDADKLDYLERDALNCGVKYGLFDRQGLINNLCIMRNQMGFETIGIKQQGIQALESFVLARYYMFSQIYIHPEERLLRILAVKDVRNALPNGVYPDDINKYLKYDDDSFKKKISCIKHRHDYKLLYDGRPNTKMRGILLRSFGEHLIIDTPQKTIFRTSDESPTVMCLTITGKSVPCEELSPVLDNIKFASIQKMRIYALNSNEATVNRITEVIKRNE